MNKHHDLGRPIQRVMFVLRRVTVPASILLLNAAMLLGVLSPASSSAAGARVPRLGTQLNAYLAKVAGQGWFSGSALVARHGEILLSKGYGLADREHKAPNTPDTTYSVSINAPTAILGALILEEQGKLADNTSICRYLTGCPAAWQRITIGMMLDGTAAIPDYDWGHNPGRTVAQALHDLQARSLFGKPGTRINYSNGYTLVLDSIVEKVTGAPYATFLQQAIAGPAGMAHTGRLAGKQRPAHFAQVYSGATHLTGWAYDDAFPLYATTPDLYAYDTALFGGKIVSAKTRQRMFAPRIPLVPPDPGVSDGRRAYAWKTGRITGHRVIYAVGGSTGVSTANLYFPQEDVTIILNSNDDNNDFEGIAVHLAALVFGQSITAPILPAHAVAPATAILATFTGHDSVGNFPAAFTPGALWFPTQGPNGFAGTVTRLDTRTGRVVATIKVNTLPQGQPEKGEGDVAVVNGQVWAVDSGAQTLVRIDPATNQVVATIHLGIPATALASAGNTLWATADPALGDAIVRVDLRTQKSVAVIQNAGHPNIENAATPDALWYVSTDTEEVVRVDAATNKIAATIRVGTVPQTVFVGAGSVWVGDASGALVSRLDPRTNKVIASIKTGGYPGNRQPAVDDCACRYVVGYGSVWVIANSTTLLRIDPVTNLPVASLTFATRVGSIGLSDGSIWVGSDVGNPAYTIYRVDPQAIK